MREIRFKLQSRLVLHDVVCWFLGSFRTWEEGVKARIFGAHWGGRQDPAQIRGSLLRHDCGNPRGGS